MRDFIQVNDAVNQQMLAQALEGIEIEPNDQIIEGVATLVANGQYNAHKNLLSNLSFYQENLEDEIARQS